MDSYEFIKDRVLGTAHTLIAGTTGSGKSVLLNSVIYSAYAAFPTYEDAQFWFFDLKRVELARYKNTDQCISFITEPGLVGVALDTIVQVMESRYSKMEPQGLLKWDREQYYVFIDELADLMTVPGVLPQLVKIGRLGRAAGIHLICATQDPSRRTLVASLMQNFTCCIALRCRSAIESRQIIGVAGAETLPRYGQALLWDAEGVTRFDVPMTPDDVLNHISKARPRIEIPEGYGCLEERIGNEVHVYYHPLNEKPKKKSAFYNFKR